MADDKLLSAIDVAKYVMCLAGMDAIPLSDKKLQKIIYYAQGYSLARHDHKLFADEIRAWRNGPVVRSVYDYFRNLTDEKIEIEAEVAHIPKLTKCFIASVWEDFKECTERELIDMTHMETPWVNARGGIASHRPSDKPIRDSDMREFFSQPSIFRLSAEELMAIANCPDRAPPESWYNESDVSSPAD